MNIEIQHLIRKLIELLRKLANRQENTKIVQQNEFSLHFLKNL